MKVRPLRITLVLQGLVMVLSLSADAQLPEKLRNAPRDPQTGLIRLDSFGGNLKFKPTMKDDGRTVTFTTPSGEVKTVDLLQNFPLKPKSIRKDSTGQQTTAVFRPLGRFEGNSDFQSRLEPDGRTLSFTTPTGEVRSIDLLKDMPIAPQTAGKPQPGCLIYEFVTNLWAPRATTARSPIAWVALPFITVLSVTRRSYAIRGRAVAAVRVASSLKTVLGLSCEPVGRDRQKDRYLNVRSETLRCGVALKVNRRNSLLRAFMTDTLVL